MGNKKPQDQVEEKEEALEEAEISAEEKEG